MLRALLALAIGASLIGCADVDTLGDEEPDETVVVGEPTWVNGVGAIILTKCANCHSPDSQYAPSNTPKYLDFSNEEGAEAAAPWILAGILNENIGNVRQMPLDYSTPVTDREKEYLETWANNVMSRDLN